MANEHNIKDGLKGFLSELLDGAVTRDALISVSGCMLERRENSY